MATAVPAKASISTAWRTHSGRPTASNTTSTPSPPVIARTASTGSPAPASTVSVAPSRSAHSSFRGTTSTPGQTFAVCNAARTPVETPQPSRHARDSASSPGIGTTCGSVTTECPQCSTPVSTSPFDRRARGGWCSSCPHRRGAPRRHWRQRPHGTAHVSTTRSPGRADVTPAPTASTTPAPSWPSSIGQGAPQFPCSIAQTSLWQTPLAAIRTSTSPGPGSSMRIGSTRMGAPARSTTAPKPSVGIPPPDRRGAGTC